MARPKKYIIILSDSDVKPLKLTIRKKIILGLCVADAKELLNNNLRISAKSSKICRIKIRWYDGWKKKI